MTKYTFFMLLNATPAWLSLSREERREFGDQVIGTILARHPDVAFRFFDTEAFSGHCSDIAVFEAANLREYSFVIDALRDTPFYTVPYFDVVDIIPGVEDGYKAYEATL